MWFKRKPKIDPTILHYHFSDDIELIQKEIKSANLGLGYVDISVEQWRKSRLISNAEFKKIINDYFKVEIAKIGFIGNDYKYIKEYKDFTAVINFFPWRYDGGMQVDLLVKINSIKYPPYYRSFRSSKSLKSCEFSKRLAPINSTVWVWAFEDTEIKNKAILDDIIRLIHGKGLAYFALFENLDSIVKDINISTFENFKIKQEQDPITGFPSTNKDYNEWLMPFNYFIFEYSRLHNNISKAIEHARYGMTLSGARDTIYHLHYNEVYEKFIAEHSGK